LVALTTCLVATQRDGRGAPVCDRLWASGHKVVGGLHIGTLVRLKGPCKNNFGVSGLIFWPLASWLAPYRPTGGVCSSLAPRQRPKSLRHKHRIYFCTIPKPAASRHSDRVVHGTNVHPTLEVETFPGQCQCQLFFAGELTLAFFNTPLVPARAARQPVP